MTSSIPGLETLLAPATGRGDDVSFRWATVTDTAPVSILLDGDSEELDLVPDSLVGTPPIGSRVWVQRFNRRVLILGVAGVEQAPALPDPVDTAVGDDQTIAAIAATESPTPTRASITNPSTTDRMLVRQLSFGWVQIVSSAEVSFYASVWAVSGGIYAAPAQGARALLAANVPQDYLNWISEVLVWVAPGDTYVGGIQAWRSVTGNSINMRYTHTQLQPLRFSPVPPPPPDDEA